MTAKSPGLGRFRVPGRGRARRRRVLAVLAGAAALWGAAALGAASAGAVPAGLAAVRAAGSWGKAFEIPGLRTLDNGGYSEVLSVSCASKDNCAAAGIYVGRRRQAFVASERHGRWGKAIEVPGLGTLDVSGYAWAVSVSCGAPGSCAAGGNYWTNSTEHGFAAIERHGRWGKAIEMPGPAAPASRSSQVLSVSCGAAGGCAAGGLYIDSHGHVQGFVATERDGRWGSHVQVPGLAALNEGGNAWVMSVSCGSAGNCAAGGHYYTDDPIQEHGFVAAERHGHWNAAIEVPGLAALDNGQDAAVGWVSCAPAGYCAAGGDYGVDPSQGQGFLVTERNGTWGTAIGVNQGTAATVSSVSCASAGNCAAAGDYYDGSGRHMFVLSEHAGTWGTAAVVPAPHLGTGGTVVSLSCASAGRCAIGGSYPGPRGKHYGFVAAERNGHWGTAIQEPGQSTPERTSPSRIFSVSCPPAGPCTAGGWSAVIRGFLVTQTG